MPNMSLPRALALGLLAVGVASAGACGGDDDKPNTPAAVVKFCNPLSLMNMQPLDLTLDVGGTNPVSLTAGSGTCVPAAKTACLSIPAGMNVPIVLKMGTMRLTSTVLPEIKAGEEWLVLADLDDTSNAPILQGGPLDTTKAKCADLAFTDIFETNPTPTPTPMPMPRI